MDVYSELAAYYDLMFNPDYAGEARICQLILNSLGISGGSLLDVGSGTGSHVREFKKLGFRVEGLEPSDEMTRIAIKKNPGVHFHKGKMESMKLDKEFNVITALSRTLLFVKNKKSLEHVIKKFYEHLVKGGVLILEINVHSEFNNPDFNESNFFKEGLIQGSMTEEYDIKKDKILWGTNLSIDDNGRLIRGVQTEELLLINVRELFRYMKKIGFRVYAFKSNGEATENLKQSLLIACVKK